MVTLQGDEGVIQVNITDEEGDRLGKHLEGSIGKSLYYGSWHKEECRVKENLNYLTYSTIESLHLVLSFKDWSICPEFKCSLQ